MSKQQAALFKFSPVDGRPCDPGLGIEAKWFLTSFPRVKWCYNPWTGEVRLNEDIESDPYGLLIVPPGEPLYAVEDVVTTTLSERGKRYGVFAGHADVTQKLKETMRAHPGWARLAPDQKEALEMVVHKIGRVLNGDPNYDDSWVDIAGYAKLVADRLQAEQKK